MLRGLALTTRLTLFFTSVAAALVLGLGWLFMAAADRHFIELDQAALHDKQHLIEDLLASANSAEDMRWRLSEALGHHHGLFAQVQDAHGTPLFQTEGLPAAANAPQHHGPAAEEPALRVLRFEARPHYAPASTLQITLSMQTAHHAQFLAELRRSLLLYALVATLLSGLLGGLAAHQGLAPLRAMRARAAGVSGQQMDERMPVEAVPVEMAELARELNRMLDRLQSDFQRLQAFSSDLAHELRTPISNLLTQTQVMLSAPRDAGTYRDTLASNAEELQRLARTVSDMLFLAKTERTVALPQQEHFAAMHEVQALLEFYEAVAEEKHIALRAQGEGNLYGNRLMFRRAVSNLLSNALRHTPEGGLVEVRIETTLHGSEVTVENTGPDIDPQALPRLFDRFFRANPARSHSGSDGAGLGLSITQAIAQAHGGDVRVQSEHGLTRFTLRLPSAPSLGV